MVRRVAVSLLAGLALALTEATAQAQELLQWSFNPTLNQLEFQTDQQVMPQAQLVFNPARIVIDLPRTRLRGRRTSQSFSGPVRAIRVAQTTPDTVRLVVELAPTANIDPGQLQVQGISPTRWLIRLPGLPASLATGRLQPLVPTPSTSLTPRTVQQPRQSWFRPRPQPSQGQRVVVIDPGHGGPDPGAIGHGGIREKDVVLDVALQVNQLLSQQGLQVMMTRTADVDVDLPPRVALAESSNADIFVSIHANAISMSRPEINGLETYYFASREGRELAEAIHNSILQSVTVGDRGIRQARFYVLRKTTMPSVLVEMGYLTNPQDASNLADPNHRGQMAEAISRGILQYIQQN
jgi:N-acetylmuramoyl-L-alanine amidase